MVEQNPTTQLPIQPGQDGPALQFMNGSLEDLRNFVKGLLEEVEMNQLEIGLLDHHLKDPK